MTILLNNYGFDNRPWFEALSHHLPDMRICVYPDVGDPRDVEYAVVWDHPHGDLATYPNLRAILNLGAGLENLVSDETLPPVPIVRLVDEAVAQDMAQHTLYWVINFHRSYYRYTGNAARKHWERYDYPATSERRIGILGLGSMGSIIARHLQRAGFTVGAWVRSPRQQGEVELYIGDDKFMDFCTDTDILISVLPETPDTVNFLNRERLALFPTGVFLVNIGRASVIDETALHQALDSGHIEAAALDVFRQEPLPLDSWLWTHPRVHITPHASGITYARSAAKEIARNITRLENGEAPYPVYDPARGY